jgi:hypothetical protein
LGILNWTFEVELFTLFGLLVEFNFSFLFIFAFIVVWHSEFWFFKLGF